ncbi:MAG TPA: glycosyltransferase family 4 protein [Solirubrobacteraceae bacterium]|jgi:glycogen(starch) synthase|nr:glycosyltransferase family 4 protein [Solirubrobacteraceae bacterium]
MSTRALILSWEYPPVIEGGLARHVRKLAEALVRQGVAVDVLTRGVPREPELERARVGDGGGVSVHRVPEPGWPRDLDRFVAWVEQMNRDMLAAGEALAQEHSYELVHGHDWLVGQAATALADRLRVPYVTTIHATEHGRHQGWVEKPPQSHIHSLERRMARRADRVIVCSYYMRGHVADIFDIDERRVAVIPNGVDPSELQPTGDLRALRNEFAAPHEKLVLLVGRLVYEKGFQLALDALPGVIEQVGNVRFLVAGSGTHEAELKAQAQRLGLSEHGTFLGWIGDDVLHSLYRIADLCVVPSIYEPFGLVALEAMASGCPCIVADTGGLREVVPLGEHVGLRFNGGDAEHLGVMIERLLVDEGLRDRLVTQASEHVLRFDWDDIAERTRAIYDGLRQLAPRQEPREGVGRG